MTHGLTTKGRRSFSRIYNAYFSVVMLLFSAFMRVALEALNFCQTTTNKIRTYFVICLPVVSYKSCLLMLLVTPNWQDISHCSCLSVDANFRFLFPKANNFMHFVKNCTVPEHKIFVPKIFYSVTKLLLDQGLNYEIRNTKLTFIFSCVFLQVSLHFYLTDKLHGADRFLFKKLILPHLIKKFPAFY